jgi:hypothetical protein
MKFTILIDFHDISFRFSTVANVFVSGLWTFNRLRYYHYLLSS